MENSSDPQTTESRIDTLKKGLCESETIIRQYLEILRTSDRPEEKLRAERMVRAQWPLVVESLDEYRSLAGEDLSEDLAWLVERAPHWEEDLKKLTVIPRRRRIALWATAAAVMVWLALFIPLQWPPFHPGPGWQRLGPKEGEGLARLHLAGDVLLIGTYGESTECGPLDRAVWRSEDHGAHWDPIDVPELEFDRSNGECLVAAVRAFAHSPADPRRVYAATSDVGLLRSDDAGQSWYLARGKEDTDQEGAGDGSPGRSLRHIAVDSSDPDLVFVAPKGNGLFRSRDGGRTWEPLDGEPTCLSGGGDERPLPRSFLVGALLAVDGALYAGAYNASNQAPTNGFYASRDGGSCWRLVDDAEDRFTYQNLAHVPDSTDQLLALTRDSMAQGRAKDYELWTVEGDRGRTTSLWRGRYTTKALHISPGPPAAWYVVTDFGGVFSNRIGGAARPEKLPRLNSCLPYCLPDLAADPAAPQNPPLLLVEHGVYRLANVPWYRRLWP